MKVLIIDDEPKAIELLRGYLLRFENLEFAHSFRNGIAALEYVETNPVDLIFLDINMPYISGLAFAKSMKSNAKIIFTTAYSEHAAESYDIEAIDYLLKPISFERFAKAIRKAQQINDGIIQTKSIFLRSGNQSFRVFPHEILYLEKDGNYITFHFNNSKCLARYSIAEALALLPDYFIQVHKSFIINIEVVDVIGKDKIEINGQIIPIGSSFRETLKTVMSNKFE